ncbi:hypothetical protein DFH09DRAFT_1286786, partial [Mycena vulgaris]
MMFSPSVVRISAVAAFLLLLSSVFEFFRPSPVPLGPITLEDHFADMIPELFALSRAFEELQELWAPSVLVMRYPDYDNGESGPIYIDVTRPKSNLHDDYDDDMSSLVDASVIRDASDLNIPLIDPRPLIAPRPGALPSPSHGPSSTAAILLAFGAVTFCIVAAGSLFLKRALAPKNRGLARIVSRRVAHASRPQYRSSGETRRCWALPRCKRGKKFLPSLPTICESPWADFTFDGAGFLKALKSLAREQQEAKTQHQEPNASPLSAISATDNATAVHSSHVRALTEDTTSTELPQPSKPANIARCRSRTRTAPGQMRLVPGSPTPAGVAVRRILPISPLRLPVVARTPPPISCAKLPSIPSTRPPLGPVAVVPSHAPLASPFVVGQILYQTPPTSRNTSVIYETPAPTPAIAIYSTSGSTSAALTHPAADPLHHPAHCTSGIVFHGRFVLPQREYQPHSPLVAFSPPPAHNPFTWTQLQSQAASHHRA